MGVVAVKENKSRITICAMIMGLLYVLPIILANRYYNDDVQQVLYLSPVWMKDGRPLLDLLLRLLCGANNYIFDLFPLTLFLAVFVMIFASIKWTEKFYECDDRIAIIVSVLPLTMGFLLSNLSYRFDCISYPISAAFLMIPFLTESTKTWKKIAINTICILISMCFYQGTVGMYIALVAIVMFIRCFREENMFEDVIMRAVSVITGAVIYKIAIAPIFVDKLGYRAEAGNLAPLSSMPSTMVSNIYGIAVYIWMYLKSLGARQVIMYAVILLLGAIATYTLLEGRSAGRRALAVILYCVLLPVVFVASVLPKSVLENLTVIPNHLPELISLMFVLSLSLVMISKKWPRIALVLGLFALLFRFSFSYAYGNILRQQKEYADFMAQSIAKDIEGLNDENIDKIIIDGEVPYSPVANSLFEMMPILKEMVPPALDKDGMLNGALINHYYPRLLDVTDIDDEARSFMKDSGNSIVSNLIYDLYLDKKRIYVRFK